ncbi:MAG: tetratricopeptide repeat protein [Flavobacteriales bacterium]
MNVKGFVGIALIGLALTGCQPMNSLTGTSVPYGKETQLAYFEGQGHLLKGDYEDAYASFLSCAESEPEEMAFHYQLGKIDLKLERFEAAELHLDRAHDLEPDNTWVLYHRGLARLGQGNGEGAEQDWTPFVTARPGDLEALLECSDLLLREGHVLPTLNLLYNYEENVGHDEDVRTEALRIVELTSDPEGMGQFLARAREDFPESDTFQLQWARYLMAKGDLDACQIELAALSARRPNWGKVSFEWAEYWTRKEDLPAALPHLEKAMASDDVAVESKLRVLVGYGYLAQGDPEFEAPYSSLLDHMMKHHGDEPAVVEMACDWAYQNKRFDEALGLALTLVELAPGAVETWTNLMAIRIDMRDWAAMVEDAEQAIARFPLEPTLFYFQGTALRENGQDDKAVKAFKAGLGVVLDNPVLEGALASQLAWSHRSLGELDRSEEAFERSLRAYEDAIVLNNHAYFMATRKDIEATPARLARALECSTRANELAPGEGNFMDTQAHVLFMMGSHEEALQWILDAQDNGMAGDPVALEHEGDIRWALGQKEAAREVWQKALDFGGDQKVLTPKINRP